MRDNGMLLISESTEVRCPPLARFHFPQFQVWKQMILLTYYQKVSRILALYHNACVIHLISSHHTSISSSEFRAIRYFERESDHIHIIYITAYCQNCSIIVVNILLYLIYKLYHRYVCIEKKKYVEEKTQHILE